MILGYAEIQEAFVPEDIVVKLPAVKVEGKLYSNRYLVDSHNPHIKVKTPRQTVAGLGFADAHLSGRLLQHERQRTC